MFANDGTKFDVLYHRQWDEKVKSITGGLTIFRAGRGKWVDPESGITYEERMIPVRIFCTREQIEEIADFTLVHYDQIAVGCMKVSEEAMIFTR